MNKQTRLSRAPEFSAAALGYGWASIAARLLFEAVVVGWSEELLFRGALQRLFNAAFGNRSLGRLRAGTWIAALLFAAAHLGNITYQPVGMTLAQSGYALVIGLASGITTIKLTTVPARHGSTTSWMAARFSPRCC